MQIALNIIKIVCLFLLLTCVTNAQVRHVIGTISTSTGLMNYYQNSGQYEKRYILRYLPWWLNSHNISPVPPWVHDAVGEALSSNEPMLVKEAVVLTGKYGYLDFFPKLAGVYRKAHLKYPEGADMLRCQVITTILNFGGNNADSLIPAFLMSKPRFILCDEFSLLLVAVKIRGDTASIYELESVESEINSQLANVDPKNDPSLLATRYKQILQKAEAAKQELKRRYGK